MCMPCSDTIRLFYLILTVTVRQGRTRPAIINYLHDNTDSRLPAHLAAQSEFPNAHAHTLRSVCEVPQSGNGTSMLLSGDDSLAALTTGLSTITSEMTSMSCDAQKVGKSRILVEGENGILLVPRRSQLQGPLECPFNLLFCLQTFATIDDWFKHSLSHFRDIGPPIECHCCFCDAKFEGGSGLQSWGKRMEHVAYHHQLGCRMAHARPDFALYTYLWKNRLIGDAEYKDIRGTVENRQYPSPLEGIYQYHSVSCLETALPQPCSSRTENRVRRRRTERGFIITW